MSTIDDYKVLMRMKRRFNYFESHIRILHQEFDDYDIDCDGFISRQDLLYYFRNTLRVKISEETISKMITEIDSDMNGKICFYEYVISSFKIKNRLDEYTINRLKSLHKIYENSYRQQNLYRSFNLYLMAIIDCEKDIITSLFEIHLMINTNLDKDINMIRNDIINNHVLFQDYMNKKQLIEFLRNEISFSLNGFRNNMLTMKFS